MKTVGKRICISKLTGVITFVVIITFSLLLLSFTLLNVKNTYKSKASEMSPISPLVKGNFIVNGTDAAEGRWPFIARLYFDWGPGFDSPSKMGFCDATLIAPQWLLTAAHCFPSESIDDVKAFIGSSDLSSADKKDGKIYIYNLKKPVYIHPNYLTKGKPPQEYPTNDFALVKLSTPVNDEITKPIKIGNSNIINEGDASIILGWGYNNKTVGTTNLQQGVVPILSTTRVINWSENYRTGIDTSNIIAGFPKGGVSTCGGDSGGPLLIWENGQWVQIGVVSWGGKGDGVTAPFCGAAHMPSVFAKLSQKTTETAGVNAINTLDWINSTIDQNTSYYSKLNKTGRPKNSEDFFIGTNLSAIEKTDYVKKVCSIDEWAPESLPHICSVSK